jgi:hypothetical protein
MPIPIGATGSHQRVRLKLAGLVLHATVIPGTYSATTGGFEAYFDVDAAGTAPNKFVPAGTPQTYVDQNGVVWELIN